MKRDFVSVTANNAQATREALSAELSDVNGGLSVVDGELFVAQSAISVVSGRPILRVVTWPIALLRGNPGPW